VTSYTSPGIDGRVVPFELHSARAAPLTAADARIPQPLRPRLPRGPPATRPRTPKDGAPYHGCNFPKPWIDNQPSPAIAAWFSAMVMSPNSAVRGTGAPYIQNATRLRINDNAARITAVKCVQSLAEAVGNVGSPSPARSTACTWIGKAHWGVAHAARPAGEWRSPPALRFKKVIFASMERSRHPARFPPGFSAS